MSPRAVSKSARVCGAAASDLNDEYTVLWSAIDQALALTGMGATREYLLDARAALQRSTWIRAGMLNYARQEGVRASAVSVWAVLDA